MIRPKVNQPFDSQRIIEQNFTKEEQRKINDTSDHKRAMYFLSEYAFHERMWRYHYAMMKYFKNNTKWADKARNPRQVIENTE